MGYDYLLFFWLGPLRDADDEFTARSRHWGGLLKTIQIPADLEAEVKTTLDSLDGKLLAADPNFVQISNTVGNATEITAGEKPGAAKLRMLPLEVRDLIARAGIVIRNEDLRPWLPLDHHEQGHTRWKARRQITPRDAAFDDIEDGIQNLSQIGRRPTAVGTFGQHRFEIFPLGIGKAGIVDSAFHASTEAPLKIGQPNPMLMSTHYLNFQTVS
jgi:hypothetical protein